MLLRSRRPPIGVSVALSKPNKQSLDFGFVRFCTSSRERTVERSAIIEPSEGSYLILKDRIGNVFERVSSTYLRAWGVSVGGVQGVLLKAIVLTAAKQQTA